MSVEHYHCESCGESIYEEYVGNCSCCNHRICTWCLVNNDIDSNYAHYYNVKFDGSLEQKEKFRIEGKEENPKYGYEIGDIIDDSGIDSKYCPYCNNTKVSDDDLFKFLLKKYSLDYEKVKEEYIKSR